MLPESSMLIEKTPDTQELLKQCAALIKKHNLTISFAESASAGAFTYGFSQTEEAGEILKGGLVCYDACLKEDILKIPDELIKQYTPESAEVTRAMAEGLGKLIKSDITVAVTGLPKPGGSEQPGKPVGTMFYCILWDGIATARKKIFTGSPAEIVNSTLEHVVKTIVSLLNTSVNGTN